MKAIFFYIIILFVGLSSVAIGQNTEHYWNGNTGDWNDATNWVDKFGVALNSVPDGDDDVFIDGSGNYNISPGDTIHLLPGTYEINDIYIRNFTTNANPPQLHFEGFFPLDTVHLNVNGNIKLDPDFDILYGSDIGLDNDDNLNRWVLYGDNSHTITSNGVDMNYVRIDSHNVKTTLIGDLIANYRVSLEQGELFGDDIEINTNVFRVYTKPSPAGYNKLVNLINNSNIICQTFNAIWNYGTDSYSGDFSIDTHLFKGGSDSQFGDIYLRDTVLYPLSSEFFAHNLQGDNVSVNNLTIDSPVKTRIKGNITVLGDFIVKQEDQDIIFDTRRGHVDTLATFKVLGDITLPTPSGGDCKSLTRFKIDRFTEKKMHFKQSSGVFSIENATIRDIGTLGNATFEATNCVVYDYPDEWDNIIAPVSEKFYWIGDDGFWHDAANWSLSSGGSAGTCIPSVSDHVFFDNNSFPSGPSTVTVKAGEPNHCRNFSWTANSPNTLNFVTSPQNYAPTISISGDLYMNQQITITNSSSFGIFDFETNYSGTQEIYADNIDLPRLFFANRVGSWKLFSDIDCNQIITKGGTLNTNDYDIDCSNSFVASTTQEKTIELGTSTINALEKISFGLGKNVTVDADSCTMITKEFEGDDGVFYSLTLQNIVNESFSSRTYRFDKLIIDGTGKTTVQDSLVVDSLIFLQDEGALDILISSYSSVNAGVFITGGIKSVAAGINPPKLYSSGSAVIKFKYEPQNLCIIGPLEVGKMNAIGNGIVHIPDGIDLSGNTGIDFGESTDSDNLYWIGGQGNYADYGNWSPNTGHCPEDNNPFYADTLFFEDIGISAGDTVFIQPTPAPLGNVVSVKNSGMAIFALEAPLNLNDDLVIDGGHIELLDHSNNNTGHLRTKKFLHVINNGELKLNTNVILGRKPTSYANKTFYVDDSSTLHGSNGVVSIASHTNAPGYSTIEIDQNASGDMSDLQFQVIHPVNSSYNTDMEFEFGGHYVKEINFFNYTGTSQSYLFSEDVQADGITIETGEIIVKTGVVIDVK